MKQLVPAKVKQLWTAQQSWRDSLGGGLSLSVSSVLPSCTRPSAILLSV